MKVDEGNESDVRVSPLACLFAAMLATPAYSQSNTICTPSGQTVYCHTNTVPAINPYIAAEQQRQNYQTGAALGGAIGYAIAAGKLRHARVQFRQLLQAGKCQEAQAFALDRGDMQAAQAVPSLCTPAAP